MNAGDPLTRTPDSIRSAANEFEQKATKQTKEVSELGFFLNA